MYIVLIRAAIENQKEKAMKKYIILILAIIVPVLILCTTTPSYARHRIVIPYSYVGDGWDTVLIVSNTSGQTISPIVYVQEWRAIVPAKV